MYLIYSRKHSHGEVMWWAPNRCGYTRDANHAGRYSLEEAREICVRPEDSVPIHIDNVFGDDRMLDTQLVVDEGFGVNREALALLVKRSIKTLLRKEDLYD